MPSINKPKRDYSKKIHDPYYDSPRWRRTRQHVLFEDPFCYRCRTEGIVTIATVCDHILSRKLFPELEWDRTNLGGLCKKHDDIKRQIESVATGRDELIMKLKEKKFITGGGSNL